MLKLAIDHGTVAGPLMDFPVLVDITNETVKGATDFHFLAVDRSTPLRHEISSCDPEQGNLRAWVCLSALSDVIDTEFYLVVGPAAGAEQGGGGDVWDDHYGVVRHGRDPAAREKRLEFPDAMTVAAFVTCEDARPEAVQAIVSQWSPQKGFDAFAGYDAGNTGGMDTTGFFGAVFDGRYVYFVPQHDRVDRHGKVLRYDTHGAFKKPESWTAYDAGETDGLNTKGYYGAVYDGRFITFIPRRDSEGFHCCMLRYDTCAPFDDGASWRAFDVGPPDSHQSAAFDGRYIYCCPGQRSVPQTEADDHDEGHSVTGMLPGTVPKCSGVVLRCDTAGDFRDTGSYTTFDVSGIDNLDTRDFDGACFDGRYIYFAPLSYGAVLRYDTSHEFTDRSSWSAYNARPLGLTRNVGVIFDGRYLYFVPYGETEAAVRYDTHYDFKDDQGWEAYDIKRTVGRRMIGYDGACFDGRYIYYIAYWDAGEHYHGEMLRYDTQRTFADPQSWDVFDAGHVDGLRTIGFNGGCFDGRYMYCAPWNDGSRMPGLCGHGAVLRYDTIGALGTFSLRYTDCGHNGGLCASLPGPRFIVALEGGVISITSNRIPEKGMHHIAGVYDGRSIKLFIDGELVNEQPASGRIQSSDCDVTVGSLPGGSASFRGSVGEVRVSNIARSDDWLATTSRNLRDPGAFCRVVT